MSERDLRDIVANGHRINDIHNIAGGLANVLNQANPVQTINQMARLQRSLALELSALRADVTKLARHLVEQDHGGTEIE